MFTNHYYRWCWYCVLVLFIHLFPVQVTASESKVQLSLEQAIERTLNKNPQLHQYKFNKARLMAKRSTSALSPAYNLDVELENFAGSGSMKGVDNAEITLALSSVIELGNKRQSRVAVFDARVDQLNLIQQTQTLDVLGNLTADYIACLSTQEKIKLAKEALSLSEALVKTVRIRSKHGATSDTEVIRAEAAVVQAKIHLSGLRQKFNRQKLKLINYWGETQTQFSALKGNLFAFGTAQTFTTLYEKIKQSPAIKILATESRLQDAKIKLARTQNTSDITWQFGIRRFEDTDDTALITGISIPLFSEGRNRGAVAEVLAERNAIEAQQETTLLELHNQLFNAFSQRQQHVDAVDQLNKYAIPALEKALKLTQTAYERGRLKYRDWIDAQKELLNTKQQRIESATTALLNQAVIEQLIAEPLTHSFASHKQ